MSNSGQHLKHLLEKEGLTLSDDQLTQFEVYYEQLIEWNQKINLTGIVEKEEVFIKHFYDSIAPAFYLPMNNIQSIIDIGAGAGFPSIPLKIVFPHLHITIVDALKKRITFLEHLVDALHIQDVSCLHGRAEDVGQQTEHREHYDLATARAVAKLNVLNEFCLPFVKVGGCFVALKANIEDEEHKYAASSAVKLGGSLTSTHEFTLPIEEAKRQIIVVNKKAKTPKKYPRKAGTPLKKPLV
ncbi:16S rRNA (guanine(527)-N(7))-methyltransferase RsmG [Longirhabdus pacifica]|uniref:16S rRNA (guanine(527)-N(7))-methyltransferase RsmG n=1 Tax=Longirhabdus pacifica TaxID=2305227 RepID=UPI0010092B62|nr:16S rRNA (guanine(527)-N(7))-methyltransferase RsmG [Longirhabdus pacifica]